MNHLELEQAAAILWGCMVGCIFLFILWGEWNN